VAQKQIALCSSKTAAMICILNSWEHGAIFTVEYRTKGGSIIEQGITTCHMEGVRKGALKTSNKDLRMISSIQVQLYMNC